MKNFKKKLDDLKGDQQGSAMVLIAIAMVAILGFTALVTDIGLMALDKERLANAVDAAALAGAHELPVNPFKAREVAASYAQSNGCDSAIPTVLADNDRPNSKITVTASREVNFIFARILGFNTSTVNARATARVEGLTSFNRAVPLSIPDQTFNFYTRYTLKQGSNSDEPSPLGPGNLGALSLGGNDRPDQGASIYEDNLRDGYDGKLAVGDLIDTETGDKSAPTLRAIKYRIGLCTHSPPCTPYSFDPGCKRILIVPVYEPVLLDHGQVKKIRIIGFAAFLVDTVEGQGKENYIYGYFIKMVANGDSNFDQADYGLYGARLIE